MSEICKNCTEEIILNFCGNCGQKKSKRIDQTYIKDEIQYTVFHMNKGFFYSIKNILKAPGKTAREFLEGKRVNHYKPLLLVFVISGVSAFLTNTFIHPEELLAQYYEAYGKVNEEASSGIAASTFMYKYSAIIMLLTVPFMAFFSWLTFKKWGYNYYEHIVSTAYLLVYLQLLTILIIIPLQYLFKNNLNLFIIITTIPSTLLMIGTLIWFYIDFYDKKSAGDVVMRLFIFGVIITILFIVLSILFGIGLGIYKASQGIASTLYVPLNLHNNAKSF